jgi:hypothetical protein
MSAMPGEHAGGVAARLMVRYLQLPFHEAYSSAPLMAAEGDLQYNTIGGSSMGVTTGLNLHGRFMIGGAGGTSGCDIYYGASVALDARGEFQSSGGSAMFTVGPETGLICRVGETTFLVSPSVRAGWGGTISDPYWRNGASSWTDWLHMGGIARLAVSDSFIASLETLFSPDVMASAITSEMWQATLDLSYRVTPEMALSMATSVRRWDRSFRSGTTDIAPEDVGPGITDFRGTVTVLRTF